MDRLFAIENDDGSPRPARRRESNVVLEESHSNLLGYRTPEVQEEVRSSFSYRALPESISWRVARSWQLISMKLDKVGVDFFLRFFDENPHFLELFHFGGESFSINELTGERKLPPALRLHATIVMETLGKCVSGHTRLEDLVPRLRAIGHVHQKAGVQDYHYDILFRHLTEAIAAELGPEEWDGQMREAWHVVFRSLTSVIKHPNELLQMEPMEGWGFINASACAYVTFFTPFRMAGFTCRSPVTESVFNALTFASVFCLTLDMSSHWISQRLRIRKRTFGDRSKRSLLRRKIDKMVFPVRFRVSRFLRSLQMERWANWPGMDALVLASFPIQYAHRFLFSTTPRGSAGVHWSFLFGLLRMVAGARVLHFLQCAENNLMIRRRVNEGDRSALRIAKLLLTMLAVIHLSACLWFIVARVELGPMAVEPASSSFFPNSELLLGGTGVMNSYLHAIHWAWVNLAGIGDIDSTPVSSFECLVTLLVHFCGATLYTITTGNVVTILDTMAAKQDEAGVDLAELGEFMHNCHVPNEDQQRIMQGYMMHHLVTGGEDVDDDRPQDSSTPVVPDAAARLPRYLRQEVANYARAEAIKRRDPAFAHCSDDFLFAIVGALKSKSLLLVGDYFFKERDTVPQEVILIEKGTVEVISNGKCVRILQRGDIVGKRWLLKAGGQDDDEPSDSFNAQTSLRAHTACTLITGLSDPEHVLHLRRRYPTDLAILKADRDRLQAIRTSHQQEQFDRSVDIGSLIESNE